MKITVEDLQRIGIEIMHETASSQEEVGEDHREQADAWATAHGMDEGCMAMVCNGVSHAFTNAMVSFALEGAGEEAVMDGKEGIALEDGALVWTLEMTIISAFRWGFETALQYAPRTEIHDHS